MNHARQTALWMAAAAVIPVIVWGVARGDDSPLTDRAALAASAMSAWPLAALAAGAAAATLHGRARWPLAALAAVAAAALVWQLPALGEHAGRMLDANRAPWPARFGLRTLAALAIEFAWLCSVFAAAGVRASFRPAALAWGAAVLAAAIAPLAHAGYDSARRLERAAEHLAAGRLAPARRELAALERSGVWRSFRGVDVRLAGAELDRQLAQLSRECSQPLGAGAGPQERTDRARRLAQLDRTSEALTVLDPVRYAWADASLLAGALLQQRGAYSASDAAYRRALELLSRDLAPREARAARAERACNALAFNARAQGRFDAVPAIFEQARNDWPELAAAFDDQLARHYHARGQPARARRHFASAAAADPARFGAWRRRAGATLDFHGLLTLCSLKGGEGRPAQVGSMKSVAEEPAAP